MNNHHLTARAFLIGSLLLPAVLLAETLPAQVASPDGRLEVEVLLDERGRPRYDVRRDGRPLLAGSGLGLTLRVKSKSWDAPKVADPFSAGFELVSTSRASRDERYPLAVARASEGHDRCEELTLHLAQAPSGRRLDITFRAYDDGIAFRYHVPAQPGLGDVDVMAEESQFRFQGDHEVWVLDLPDFETNNEREFVSASLLSIKPESIIGPPLVTEFGGGLTVALAEAGLEKYAGLYFARLEGGNDSRNPVVTTRLAPLPSDSDVCVRGAAPLTTPWRVVMVAESPGALAESTLLWDLAPPSRIPDTSWIRGGKVAWDWWSGPHIPGADFEVGMNDRTFRHLVDFAAEFGLEYVLVDAGWYGSHRDYNADITRSIPEIDIPELVRYASERGVGILLWLNWQNLRNTMDAAFPLYRRWGVKGVKVDYMDRKDQEMVAFYQNVLRAAADHQLMVDFHGSYAGTGEERTWPNLMTREGVLGLEFTKWSDRVTPRHNVTVPFTRMLLGPMDYTPGGFRSVRPEDFEPRMVAPVVMGTRAHHLAMYVVYESNLQMVVDYPEAYRGQPGAEFLEVVPATWDETRFLAGEIGEYAVVARRRGQEWFLGAMTADARQLKIPLDFLGEGRHAAQVLVDGANATADPNEIRALTLEVTSSSSLELELVGGGGAAVHIRCR
jgi:alpha-glucosidase